MKAFIKKLYQLRFILFFVTQLLILFGSLIFTHNFFEKLMPYIFLLNIISGILLILKRKKWFYFFVILFTILISLEGIDSFDRNNPSNDLQYKFFIYFLFYVVISIEIIMQVWNTKRVDRKVIIGLMSGYVSLGLIAFFIFTFIEIFHPNSFSGTLMTSSANLIEKLDSLLYYSYITVLTIGYGEIIPVTPVAQKAAILTGLMGQFYLVIITAVVVEKYIKHNNN